MAETDYVWPFSDDDVMVDGALQAIMPLCREGQYDLIIPDREYRDPKLQKTVFSYRVNDVHTPVEYTNPAAFFERYGYSCLTFLGCLIIRASSWTAIDPSKYAGYKWFEHVCIAAEMLCTGKALVLPDCLILVRDNNASWSTQYRMVWGFHFPRALAALPHTYPGRARRKALVDAINPTNNNPARHIMRGRTGRTKSWELPSLVALSLYRFVATQCAILILYLSQIVLMLTRLFHKLRASIGPQQ